MRIDETAPFGSGASHSDRKHGREARARKLADGSVRERQAASAVSHIEIG
eukprot:CAMPEP_0183333704 /NCGR_PEP_ID=MMETSP0164_2-20130417/2542_1 /TAXON_ID=221442 /ORGANISM="Coccolithus pelagicus ssp braarudi, Strain PLY182g" /LENGTH=49 /DNA_ID= /DNA_START= /DNA_END= /DNA_ORIENTATION=